MAENSYKTLGNEIIACHKGMAKLYKPKVVLCGTILRLSASLIAESFGVVGQHYIEALRHEMIRELDACPVPLSSWREVAERVKVRESTIGLV